MYPRNAASPEPIAIGPVVQISDGAVQTSGVAVRIKPIGVSEGDGGGTTTYSTDGIVLYTPTQAETNYTSFVLIAKKTGCIPVAITIVTTANATAGRVSVGDVAGTAQTAGDICARLPAALTSNGNMKSSLLEIISTALSEGATGRIAAAFQTAWNVTSPVWTAQSVNQSGDVYPLVDTEIAAILAAVDTEVAAIKAKTDNLPSDPADASDIAGVLGALNVAASSGDPGTTTTIVAYLKQIINTLEGSAGIPTFPAAADAGNNVSMAEVLRQINSRIVGTLASGTHNPQSGDVYPLVDTEIAAILAAVDTEVAAIKTKTDNLPSDPADASDIAAAHAATDAEIAKIPKSDGVVGWNATARAQIQTEAEDALAAFWVITTGTIDNTGATQVTFRTDLTAPNSTYNDLQLEITSGALAGQTKVILTYLQTNGQITLSEALTAAPANGVTFRIKKIHTHSVTSIQQGLATAGEQTAQTTLLNTIAGYLDTEIAAILAAVDTEVAAIKAKTDNLPSDPADQSAVEAAITAFGTTQMSYSARATGAMPTRDQLMLELLAGLLMHSTTGLVKTLKKPDGTNSTKTYQFDADPPTSIQELT